MKTRFFAAAAIAVLLLNVVGFAGRHTPQWPKSVRPTRLVTCCRLRTALPFLIQNGFLMMLCLRCSRPISRCLGEIMAKINEMENRTGIDLRKFDQVAVGVAFKQVSPKEMDYEPVAIASGDINAGALIAVAKTCLKRHLPRRKDRRTNGLCLFGKRRDAKDDGQSDEFEDRRCHRPCP